MTDLTDAIDSFLAKYPDDAVLEWRDKPRKADSSLSVMVGDLVTAGERWRERTPDPAPLARDEDRLRESVSGGEA